jgi:drug/metabolite transporter (DMT)-like permease
MIIYVKAVKEIGPTSMGAVMSIVPVISAIAAIIVLNEALTQQLIYGLLFVSFGAWLAHSRFFKCKDINQLKDKE